jgi:hypothetical protein
MPNGGDVFPAQDARPVTAIPANRLVCKQFFDSFPEPDRSGDQVRRLEFPKG